MDDDHTNELLERAFARDPQAMDALVRQLTPVVQARVARVLLRYRGQAKGRELRQDLEDCVQDAFVHLFSRDLAALRAWDPIRGLSLPGYVALLSERTVLQTLRTRKRNPWTDDPTAPEDIAAASATTPSPEPRIDAARTLDRLLDRLRGELSPKALLVFELAIVEDRPVPEVQERTGMSADAIYAWRTRVRRRIRAMAAEMSGTPPATHSEAHAGGAR